MIANSIFINDIDPIMFSLISVDADPEAERLMILDRATGELVKNTKATSNTICWLPYEAATNNKFMVIILDDNAAFNAAIADNVVAELIDITKYSQ
jgi:hypothetical protein